MIAGVVDDDEYVGGRRHDLSAGVDDELNRECFLKIPLSGLSRAPLSIPLLCVHEIGIEAGRLVSVTVVGV